MKKFISILLSVLMLTSITAGLNLTAYAIGEEISYYTEDYYTYTVTDGEATITDCDTSISGDITIPPTLGGYPVTSIDDYAFQNCTNLISLTIPDSATGISSLAFHDCASFKSITVDENNPNYSSQDGILFNKDKTILELCPCGYDTSVIIPDTVTEISGFSFEYCSKITELIIPESVKSIMYKAFFGCMNLKRITIPSSVTVIADEALGYYDAEVWYSKIENFTIYGTSGSAAETYANEKGFTFIDINASTPAVPDSTAQSTAQLTENIDVSSQVTATAAPATATVATETKTTAMENVAKPKATTAKNVKAGKKKITVQWKKLSGVKGYQVQVATDKKFKKNKKTVNIKKQKTTKTTVKKLKSNKKYYVRVRTYKVVNGKKIYSKWSKVKTVKTK